MFSECLSQSECRVSGLIGARGVGNLAILPDFGKSTLSARKHDLRDNRVKNMAAHALRVLTQVAAFLDSCLGRLKV